MQPKDPTVNKNERHPYCLKCGTPLTIGKGWKYCSEYCSKLYLKAQYKKRNSEKIKAYNNIWRAQNRMERGGYSPGAKTREALAKHYAACARCGATEGLQAAHIKPHWAGGSNRLYNLIRFCQPCHSAYDNWTRSFWVNKNPDLSNKPKTKETGTTPVFVE